MVLFLCDGGGDDPFAGRREGTPPCGAAKIARAGSAGFRGAGGKFPIFSLSETLPAHGAEFANKWRFLTYVSSILATSEFLFCFISAKFMEMVLT